MSAMDKNDKLTPRQRAFVRAYCTPGPTYLNATKSYQAVYTVKDDLVARASGSRLLSNVNVTAALAEQLRQLQMSADEALALTADIARGDISDLMDVTPMGWSLNMQKAQELGKTKLIKRIKQTTTTRIGRKQDDDDVERTVLEVELYPADAALDRILRVHGAYKDVGSKDNPLVVKSWKEFIAGNTIPDAPDADPGANSE